MYVFIFLFLLIPTSRAAQAPTHYLTQHNETVSISNGDKTVISDAVQANSLNIFCWQKTKPTLRKFWTSVSMNLVISSDSYKVYMGPNVTAVENLSLYSEHYWHLTELPWRYKQFRLNPFQDGCVGVSTSVPYQVKLEYLTLNQALLICSLTSLILFHLAPCLARSTMLHYTAWVTLSITFSLVIMTYLLQKRFRQSLFSWIFLAYTFSLYTMTTSWCNITSLLSTSTWPWLLGYCIITGLVSCATLYRLGPPSHPRTLYLIQWTLQGFSLILFMMSSYNTIASTLVVVVLFLWSLVPRGTIFSILTFPAKVLFRPKKRLLTEKEVQEQSARETHLALEQLRRYCQSPERNAWQLVSRLNKPARFAEFVEGGSHVSEEEAEEHRRWVCDEDISDTTDFDTSLDITDVRDTSEVDEDPIELGHRFSCFFCNDKLLGHRFSCAHCMLE